jgi:hypothetical protein
MIKTILLAGLACCWWAMPAHAETCTPLDTFPTTISTPGKYCLARNVTANSSTMKVITIAASGVTLDCDGFTIKNLASNANGASVGIYMSGQNNVVIQNCRVIGGFTQGIQLTQDNTIANRNYYVDVKNNYVAGPYHHGIWINGSAIEVTGNRVYDIGGQQGRDAIGIRVGGSSVGFKFHTVMDNLVVGTNSPSRSAFGIYSDNTIGGIFIKNGVAGTTGAAGYAGYGIRIGGQYNRVTDNHVTGGGQPNETGIYSVDATTSCYDNYLRTATGTANCDATLGNY